MPSVDSKSVEDPNNFLDALGGHHLREGHEGYLKVWNHLFEAKDSFSNIRMFELESPYLKRLRHFCAMRAPVLLHPSLYRVVKLTYPMDADRIVLDGWMMMSELGTESPRQSVWVLSAANFRPVCE